MTEIKKHSLFEVSKEEKYVEGIVYKPNERDSDNNYMTAETIKKASDRFMRLYGSGKADIDLLHNGIAGSGYITKNVVDSEGNWVLGVKIEDDSTWQEIKKGTLKGFSLFGSGEILKSGEIVNPQISKVSIVKNPANQQPFIIVKEEKEEKSVIRKAIEYMNNLILEEKPMDNNIDTRLSTLEKSLEDINNKLTTLTKEKTETKEESNPLEQRLSKMETVQKSISEQVSLLTGASQSRQGDLKKEEGQEDLYAIFG